MNFEILPEKNTSLCFTHTRSVFLVSYIYILFGGVLFGSQLKSPVYKVIYKNKIFRIFLFSDTQISCVVPVTLFPNGFHVKLSCACTQLLF